MKNEIMLLPLTRHEFNEARSGRIIQKRFGRNSCLIISNRFVSFSECEHLRKEGFDVLPLDLSGITWHDLKSRLKTNICVTYSNGLTVALVTQSVFNDFQKERA
jgi:hypothetical protein